MDPDETLLVLGTQYNSAILGATDEPKSVKQLSNDLDIPIATCYRRVEELTEAGLLELDDRVLSDEHRRTSVYRRRVDEVTVQFTEAGYEVDVAERSQVKNKLDDVWRTMADD
ncbi:helix-turn-helix domain-containing protein [Salinirubellus salinus]|jgi:predicted ArsR family transcriptional regulator|uniref:Helix-turn-helix domain-containing protein n=1 Tax=Salinirubellus salinus TaxID=1364945 RepID=A0A9E7QZR4_9EURY|nr:helix-turn-helix domain-containing protein [Salinirubellus salinus]UWM52977.1 helix-turn-helix domain-containing protein [Salinirubellus salinus]